MRCLRNHVVLAMPGKKKQEGSIILPDKSASEGDAYEVLMVGPDVTAVVVGDTVLRPDVSIVTSRRGQDCDLEVGGRKCIVVEDTDIRVVLSVGNTYQMFLEDMCGSSRVHVKIDYDERTVAFDGSGPLLVMTFDQALLLKETPKMRDSLWTDIDTIHQRISDARQSVECTTGDDDLQEDGVDPYKFC